LHEFFKNNPRKFVAKDFISSTLNDELFRHGFTQEETK